MSASPMEDVLPEHLRNLAVDFLLAFQRRIDFENEASTSQAVWWSIGDPDPLDVPSVLAAGNHQWTALISHVGYSDLYHIVLSEKRIIRRPKDITISRFGPFNACFKAAEFCLAPRNGVASTVVDPELLFQFAMDARTVIPDDFRATVEPNRDSIRRICECVGLPVQHDKHCKIKEGAI